MKELNLLAAAQHEIRKLKEVFGQGHHLSEWGLQFCNFLCLLFLFIYTQSGIIYLYLFMERRDQNTEDKRAARCGLSVTEPQRSGICN